MISRESLLLLSGKAQLDLSVIRLLDVMYCVQEYDHMEHEWKLQPRQTKILVFPRSWIDGSPTVR
jgi:hypothetical protein